MFLALARSKPSGREMKAMGVGVSLGQETLWSLACISHVQHMESVNPEAHWTPANSDLTGVLRHPASKGSLNDRAVRTGCETTTSGTHTCHWPGGQQT
ncbi:unnamed protein product [Arctogadus glacialis]